jgi:hypothetical protein
MNATYTDSDFARIAEALRVPLTAATNHAPRFEEAAFWYRRSEQNPLQMTPSALRRKAQQIRKAAHRLLHHLGVDNPDDAADGPGAPWILDLLGYADGADETAIVHATERIGRLAEIFDAIDATNEIARYAQDAERQVRTLADALGISGHSGDRALGMWLGLMMSLYQRITGERPRMSVGASGRPDAGIAGGRFIAFLQAAGAPLGINLDSDAWRSRARGVLKHTR